VERKGIRSYQYFSSKHLHPSKNLAADEARKIQVMLDFNQLSLYRSGRCRFLASCNLSKVKRKRPYLIFNSQVFELRKELDLEQWAHRKRGAGSVPAREWSMRERGKTSIQSMTDTSLPLAR